MNLRGKPPEDSAPAGSALVVREHADLLSGGGRAHLDVVVPRTEIRGRMRLISRSEFAQVKADARKYFAALKMPQDPSGLAAAGLFEEWSLELATRVIAIAVRDPNDESKPLAILDEWRDCDDDQIDQLFARYQDYREQLDPLGPESKLSKEDCEEIGRLAKKGEASLLMQFGSWRLARFAISSALPPAS